MAEYRLKASPMVQAMQLQAPLAGTNSVAGDWVVTDGKITQIVPDAKFREIYESAPVITVSSPPVGTIPHPPAATMPPVTPPSLPPLPVNEPSWVQLLPQYYGPNAKDPDEGLGDIECDDMIATVLNKFTGIGGTFSTWHERHAFIAGASIGYNYITKTEPVPVPKFWEEESHYFLTGLTMGRAAKKLEDAAPKLKYYFAYFTAGGVTLTTVLHFLGIGV